MNQSCLPLLKKKTTCYRLLIKIDLREKACIIFFLDHKKDGNEIIANKDQSEDRSSSVTGTENHLQSTLTW